jgi:hypothetical protein
LQQPFLDRRDVALDRRGVDVPRLLAGLLG